MIVLFTDFGVAGPYVGQMKAVLYQQAPSVPLVDLMHDVPAFEPQAAAYLLASMVGEFPPESVFLCVVDPGVGSRRRPLVARINGRWFVGPDNGLFDITARHALDHSKAEWWEVDWQPERLSASFHGRDLFAPVAAKLANGEPPPGRRIDISNEYLYRWPSDLNRIVYIDHFGNAVTGLRACKIEKNRIIEVGDHRLAWARTFSDVAESEGFWYENANGLVELAANRARADALLQLSVGDRVAIQE